MYVVNNRSDSNNMVDNTSKNIKMEKPFPNANANGNGNGNNRRFHGQEEAAEEKASFSGGVSYSSGNFVPLPVTSPSYEQSIMRKGSSIEDIPESGDFSFGLEDFRIIGFLNTAAGAFDDYMFSDSAVASYARRVTTPCLLVCVALYVKIRAFSRGESSPAFAYAAAEWVLSNPLMRGFAKGGIVAIFMLTLARVYKKWKSREHEDFDTGELHVIQNPSNSDVYDEDLELV